MDDMYDKLTLDIVMTRTIISYFKYTGILYLSNKTEKMPSVASSVRRVTRGNDMVIPAVACEWWVAENRGSWLAKEKQVFARVYI
jgi:hypothetical protein